MADIPRAEVEKLRDDIKIRRRWRKEEAIAWHLKANSALADKDATGFAVNDMARRCTKDRFNDANEFIDRLTALLEAHNG
jgi:hypothetical protein